MNKQFEQFLARKDKETRDYNTCNHDKDHWCQNCIARPQEVSVELPDGTISKGFFFTNKT